MRPRVRGAGFTTLLCLGLTFAGVTCAGGVGGPAGLSHESAGSGAELAAVPAPNAVSPGPARLASPDTGENVLAWYLRAVERREAGDIEGAVVALERARALAPTDPDLALELARANAAARHYGVAAALFEEASALAPARVDLALAQARFHLDRGFRVGVALDAAERAVTLAPNDQAALEVRERARRAVALARLTSGE